MNIRTKLTLVFFTIVIVILGAISISVYLLSANYRQIDFYRRLKNRGMNTAKVLTEVREVNAELLRRMEKNNPASLPGQYIVIFDHDDQVRYNSDGVPIVQVDHALLSAIRKQQEFKFEHNEYELLGFMFTDQAQSYTIVAGATDVYGLDALRNLRNVLIATFLISAILVSVLGWLFAGRVLSPIAKIVEEVDAISGENLNRRLSEGNNQDELAKLSMTFNRMLHRLQNAFTSQKTFIANASHEIKTPITVMAGEVEVTLLQERDKDYYVRILRSLLQRLRSLNRLSTQLLVLAQASSENPQRNQSLLRIDDILWEAKDELLKLQPHYVIEIKFALDVDDDGLSVEGDHQLLKAALINLMDNGCKYSDNDTVVVAIKPDGGRNIEIEFSNTGPGIPPQVIDRIFDPFFRAVADKGIKGFGIGLSLVKRIVQLHSGKIQVDSQPQQMTRFTLSLPIAAQPAVAVSI